MFVIIAFGILALVLAGAFFVWFYELLFNNDITNEREKDSEEMKESSSNDKVLFQGKLNNDSEMEELALIEESDTFEKIGLLEERNSKVNHSF
uniref:Cbb3-type cytochrome oxidase assembly protein CcoS n=1 Tax=Parastrongyloides trichosuri TaxID=131310 RepID=A0A0N5A358_PARTI